MRTEAGSGSNISELSKSSFSTKPLVSYAVLATAVFMAIDPPNIKTVDAIGYLAASLVLATFSMRSMSSLRLVGLASNLAFIAYGYLGNLTPVLVLHALLLPVNACRLAQLLRIELPTKDVMSSVAAPHALRLRTSRVRWDCLLGSCLAAGR